MQDTILLRFDTTIYSKYYFLSKSVEFGGGERKQAAVTHILFMYAVLCTRYLVSGVSIFSSCLVFRIAAVASFSVFRVTNLDSYLVYEAYEEYIPGNTYMLSRHLDSCRNMTRFWCCTVVFWTVLLSPGSTDQRDVSQGDSTLTP